MREIKFIVTTFTSVQVTEDKWQKRRVASIVDADTSLADIEVWCEKHGREINDCEIIKAESATELKDKK